MCPHVYPHLPRVPVCASPYHSRKKPLLHPAYYTTDPGAHQKICQCSLECERLFHGSPSGIDNACATYGGMIEFRAPANIQCHKPPGVLKMILVDTLVERSTKVLCHVPAINWLSSGRPLPQPLFCCARSHAGTPVHLPPRAVHCTCCLCYRTRIETCACMTRVSRSPYFSYPVLVIGGPFNQKHMKSPSVILALVSLARSRVKSGRMSERVMVHCNL